MILEKSEIENFDWEDIANVLVASSNCGKKIEIYWNDGTMLYFESLTKDKTIYGFYYNNSNNDEWTASYFDIYILNKEIEFTTDDVFTTIRKFDLTNVIKIYVGDEWSN